MKQVLIVWQNFVDDPRLIHVPMNGAEWRYYSKAHNKYIGSTNEKAVFQIAAKVATNKEEGEGFGFDKVICTWKDNEIKWENMSSFDYIIITGQLP